MNYWFLYTTSTGEISEPPYKGYADAWTNVPPGCSVLGPIDESDPTATDAWKNPSHYTVQNGVLVKTVTDAELLQEAVSQQIATIQSAAQAVVNGQFKCKATGHTYASSVGGQVNFLAELSRFQYDSTLTTVSYGTLDAGWVDHTEQDIKNALIEGGRWKDAQYAQMNALIAQVQQLAATEGTTVEQIQAIVFTEADYQGVNEQTSDSGSTDTNSSTPTT